MRPGQPAWADSPSAYHGDTVTTTSEHAVSQKRYPGDKHTTLRKRSAGNRDPTAPRCCHVQRLHQSLRSWAGKRFSSGQRLQTGWQSSSASLSFCLSSVQLASAWSSTSLWNFLRKASSSAWHWLFRKNRAKRDKVEKWRPQARYSNAKIKFEMHTQNVIHKKANKHNSNKPICNNTNCFNPVRSQTNKWHYILHNSMVVPLCQPFNCQKRRLVEKQYSATSLQLLTLKQFQGCADTLTCPPIRRKCGAETDSRKQQCYTVKTNFDRLHARWTATNSVSTNTQLFNPTQCRSQTLPGINQCQCVHNKVSGREALNWPSRCSIPDLCRELLHHIS